MQEACTELGPCPSYVPGPPLHNTELTFSCQQVHLFAVPPVVPTQRLEELGSAVLEAELTRR